MPAGSTPSPTGAPGPGAPADRTARTGLLPLAALFLRIGLTAFGGPAGHIAIMRDEFVRRRGWLDDAAFVDLIGAANLIPGPTSTELAMHLGHRRAGRAGLVVAGLAFLLLAVLYSSQSWPGSTSSTGSARRSRRCSGASRRSSWRSWRMPAGRSGARRCARRSTWPSLLERSQRSLRVRRRSLCCSVRVSFRSDWPRPWAAVTR